MPDVKQVETPVGQRHPGVLLSLPSQKGNKFLGGNDACTKNQPDRSFALNKSMIPRLRQKS